MRDQIKREVREMEKYSIKWKLKRAKWVQKDGEVWNIHYIRYGCEFAFGDFFTSRAAMEYMKDFRT
jgi:hypothetical protein